jgi:hypothetical protein
MSSDNSTTIAAESDHGWVRVELGPPKRRSRISAAKLPLLNAVIRIVEEYRDYWPLSVRQIHYYLCPLGVLTHASKANSAYKNTLPCYKSHGIDICARARLEGRIPWEAISDETRPVETWYQFATSHDFIAHEFDIFLEGYERQLLQSQADHYELAVEKNTVLGIVKPIARRFCVALTSGRGYCTLEPLRQMALRFRASGKRRLVLLVLSDFDPEGDDIPRAMGRTLRDDFGVAEVEVIKIGLTSTQVRTLRLPPIMSAKVKSSRYAHFIETHGSDTVHELEAVTPTTLATMVESALTSLIDIDLFRQEESKQKAEWRQIERTRRDVAEVLDLTTP